MAHAISEFTRSVAPSTDYPAGDLKDNPNGTLVNRMVLTDALQFFQKMMTSAGVTPNGSDDNVSNGYQLFDAFVAAFDPAFTNVGSFSSIGGTSSWSNKSGANPVGYRKIGTHTVEICGIATASGGTVGGPGDLPIFTLPTGYRPANTIKVPAYGNIAGTVGYFATINTSGVVSIPFGNSGGGGDAQLDGIRFRIL